MSRERNETLFVIKALVAIMRKLKMKPCEVAGHVWYGYCGEGNSYNVGYACKNCNEKRDSEPWDG